MRWSEKPCRHFNRSPWTGIKPVGIEEQTADGRAKYAANAPSPRKKLPFSPIVMARIPARLSVTIRSSSFF